MITRAEIKQFVQSRGLEDTIEKVWQVNCAMVPELLSEGYEGNDCRFGLAEHIIKTAFETQTAQNLPGGAFSAFCEQFHASKQDVDTATERTGQDLEAADVAESDIATTMAWLWFVAAFEEHEEYDAELRFFLYSMANMVRGDQTIEKRGIKMLVNKILSTPALLFSLLKRMTETS